MKFRLIVTVLLAITTLKGFSQTVLNICYFKNTKGLELLATKELQRYVYLRTGRLPLLKSIAQNDNLPANSILVSSKANASHSLVYKTINLDSLVNNDAFQLKSLKGNRLVITGSTSVATLYGAYKFLQSTGIGFELDDDIIPDAILKSITLTGFNKVFTPSFELRGIQPFHDFPEGPDWWNTDDYKAIITQLPKMGMNFIGFHTYPEKNPFGGWEKAEPVSWIGTKDQLNNDGTVKSAYPALHQNTQDSTWDYLPKKTSDFNFGASQIFESDNYGADYMKGISRWPHTDRENIDIFNNMGQALNQAFSMAKSLGVKTCIGTETPLTIPGKVKAHLKSQNKDWQANGVKQELYEGIFTRIKAIHQLDYYWLWTPESWTWEGEKPEAVDQTKMDLTSALAAAKKINAPFTLATCGWVLGPSRDRTEFDRLLPKDMPFAVINRQTGFAPVEPSFKNITNRPKWQISWMEDDPAITAPQFWAGRTLKDAQDAYRYGCTGFMGIHWRTKILSPSFTALAKAGWEAADYKIKLDSLHRDYPAADLYNDWARLQFGEKAAAKTAAIFTRLDGGPQSEKDKDNRKTNFPRPVEWGEKGGGRINLNFLPWNEVEKQYAFINDFENCASLVTGANNKERYNYWLNNFYYTKNLGHIGCVLGQMDQLAKKITAETGADARKAMASQLLKLRSEAALLWKDLATRLLQTINTTGEMGTIANLEQHNLQSLKLLNKQDSILKVVLGNVPPLNLSGLYAGKPRLIVATKRTLLNNGEDFNMRVRILSAGNIQQPIFYWRPLGSKTFKPLNLKHEARNVYLVNMGYQDFKNQSFEYYITTTASSENLRYPAGDQNKTVVIW